MGPISQNYQAYLSFRISNICNFHRNKILSESNRIGATSIPTKGIVMESLLEVDIWNRAAMDGGYIIIDFSREVEGVCSALYLIQTWFFDNKKIRFLTILFRIELNNQLLFRIFIVSFFSIEDSCSKGFAIFEGDACRESQQQ